MAMQRRLKPLRKSGRAITMHVMRSQICEPDAFQIRQLNRRAPFLWSDVRQITAWCSRGD
jgi:hypothetical protein